MPTLLYQIHLFFSINPTNILGFVTRKLRIIENKEFRFCIASMRHLLLQKRAQSTLRFGPSRAKVPRTLWTRSGAFFCAKGNAQFPFAQKKSGCRKMQPDNHKQNVLFLDSMFCAPSFLVVYPVKLYHDILMSVNRYRPIDRHFI